MLNNIHIVLVNTTHPGNIGAAARALKTMGLSHLSLVQPKFFPDPEATARASTAVDILESAQVYPSLDAAIADCSIIIGASARRRSVEVPILTPRETAEWIQQNYQHQRVALLFGRERDGLTNEEMDRCQRLVTIPANPEYSSLNIASAVQVLCYELRVASLNTQLVQEVEEEPRATAKELADLYQHLEETLLDIKFLNPKGPSQVFRKLQRMFQRNNLSSLEVRMLRGILKHMQESVEDN